MGQGGAQEARPQRCRSQQKEGRRGGTAGGLSEEGILRWLRRGSGDVGERGAERVREGRDRARGRGEELKNTTPTNAPNYQNPAYRCPA
jgi:hypothetical protein